MTDLKVLTDFLDRLDTHDLHYTLSSIRESSILVSVVLSEERWEVEFTADSEVEVEVFRSDGEILDEDALEDLFEKNVST